MKRIALTLAALAAAIIAVGAFAAPTQATTPDEPTTTAVPTTLIGEPDFGCLDPCAPPTTILPTPVATSRPAQHLPATR